MTPRPGAGSRRGRGVRILGAGLLAAGATFALAGRAVPQEAEGSPEPATRVPDADEATGGDETAQAATRPEEDDPGFRWLRVRLRGRLIVRGQTTRVEGASGSDVSAENARLTLLWRPARWLRGELEYDVAENRKLRDAFLQAGTGRFSLRGGHFKPPISVIEMDSRWDVPVSERGLLSEVLRETLGITGRRPGLQGGVEVRGKDLAAFAGVFRASSVRGDRIGDEAFDNLATDWALKATGRVVHDRRRLQLGVSGDWRPAEPVPGEGYRRFWTASADAAWSQRPRDGGARLWAEGFLGSTWQDSDAFDGEDTSFLAGRLVGAWRHGGRKRSAFYVEPYAMLSAFDPDTSVRDDLMWELAGGVNVGSWRRLRLTLEAQHRGVGRNAPASLGLFSFAAPAPPFARTRLVVQLGGAF